MAKNSKADMGLYLLKMVLKVHFCESHKFTDLQTLLTISTL